MKSTKVLRSGVQMSALRIVALATLLLVSGAAHAADACTFRGPVLYCLNGERTLEAIVTRFGSEATRRAMIAEAEDFTRFENRAARERYRVSVERNNARAVRYAKRADRLARRGRISDEEYQRRMGLYRAAYANYRLAIDRYEASYWFDPVEDGSDGQDEDDSVTVKG